MRRGRPPKKIVVDTTPVKVENKIDKRVEMCQRFHTHNCFLPVTNWTETRKIVGKKEIITQLGICPNGHPNIIKIEKNLEYI